MASIERFQLTVAIPTYNRNETLKKNITFLLPQLTSQVQVIIYDNFSDTPVASTLQLELENYPQLKVVRNIANVGACGNVIRCIEFCDTQWVWLLSDDDTPDANAVQTVLKYIARYPDAHYVNFKSHYTLQRNEDITVAGENELIEKTENIHSLFLISLGIYNVNAVRPFIRFAYLFAYSLVPQFVLLIMSLKNDGKAVFSKEHVIDSQGVHKDPDKVWSYLPLSLGLPTLAELPLNLNAKNHAKISAFIKNEVISRPFASLERVLSLYKKEDIIILKHNFSQPYRRLDGGIPFLWQPEYLVCRVILESPPLIRAFLSISKKLRNKFKKPATQFASERFNRI